jgi:hypothetical protein
MHPWTWYMSQFLIHLLQICLLGFHPFFDIHIHHKHKADGSHVNVVWLHCTPSNINQTCSKNLFGPLFLMFAKGEEKTI